MHAALGNESLTRSVEDYLKAIYRLSPRGEPASTSDIAHLLDLSAPSVSGMVKRLSEQGLLEHVPYKGVQLTEDGRRAALRMIRRHRILESYLVAYLGFTWDAVHEEAERLEHAVSDFLIERMASALGDPVVDPHGDPIPSRDGSIEEREYAGLGDLSAGTVARVERVDTGDPERLRYLASIGLVPGAVARVVDRKPFGGPVVVEIAGSEQSLGVELANRVLCNRGGAR